MSFYLSIKGSPRARMAVGIALGILVALGAFIVAEAVDLGLRRLGVPGSVAAGVRGAIGFAVGWKVLWPIWRGAREGKPIGCRQRVSDEDYD